MPKNCLVNDCKQAGVSDGFCDETCLEPSSTGAGTSGVPMTPRERRPPPQATCRTGRRVRRRSGGPGRCRHDRTAPPRSGRSCWRSCPQRGQASPGSTYGAIAPLGTLLYQTSASVGLLLDRAPVNHRCCATRGQRPRIRYPVYSDSSTPVRSRQVVMQRPSS